MDVPSSRVLQKKNLSSSSPVQGDMWKRDKNSWLRMLAKSSAVRIMGVRMLGAPESNSKSPRNSEESASSSETAQRELYTPHG